MKPSRRQLARIATVALGAALWWTLPPEGLTLQAWRLFAVFITAIFAIVVNALPILTASVLAVAVAVLTRHFSVITPQGSSANLLFAGSGDLSQCQLYRLGAVTTAARFVIYAVVGTGWMWLVVK